MSIENINVENARIVFRNFSGAEGKFNPKGRRNFAVLFPSDVAESLEADGWNVKYLKPKDPEDEPQAYLSVAVSFENIPPKVMLITGQGKTRLDAESINVLDWIEIKNCDLVIRPYSWEVNGRTGIKAYLKSAWVTMKEDAFDSKYYDVPDSAQSSIING